MGRKYTVSFANVNVTALQDLFEVLAPTDAVVVIHGWHLWQTTELGDAMEEVLRLETVRGIGAVTSGSGGSTPTAQPIEDGDASFGGTVEANNTTRMAAGSGTLETLEPYGWNVRIPWTHFYTPELRPVISPGNRWTVGLVAAPGDSITMNGMLYLEEVGG